MNYFEFYEIPVNLKIDLKDLRSIYLQNSKKYHPDFYTTSSKNIQNEVLQKSGRNNVAYEVLRNENSRIKHILEINQLLQEGSDKLSAEFLGDMMDINEEMMEVQLEPSDERIDRLVQAMDKMSDEFRSPIDHLFDQEELDAAELASLKTYYLKFRYLSRLKEKLNKFAV